MIHILNNLKLSPNFTLEEFKCHCGCESVKLDMSGIPMLQAVRNEVGPLDIAVGFRCTKHNKAVGGASDSLHPEGDAWDLKSQKTVYELARACYRAGFNGIGISDNLKSDGSGLYVHAQIGSYEHYWTYDSHNNHNGITKAEFTKLITPSKFIYKKVDNIDILEFDPMDLRAAVVNCAASKVPYDTFINSNFMSGSKVIGWLISEGKILSRRDEYKTWKGNPKGTFIVYKSGVVDVGWKYDSEIAPLVDVIQFCCQGFNLFPPGMDVWDGIKFGNEGFWDPKTDKESSVGRTTRAGHIGWTGKKALIVVHPKCGADLSVKVMKELGCISAIRLDSGTPQTLKVNKKYIYTGSGTLQGIIYA
jgi:hypothetical protein